jgi:hypothetical protein
MGNCAERSLSQLNCVWFEILTTVSMKNILYDVGDVSPRSVQMFTPLSLCYIQTIFITAMNYVNLFGPGIGFHFRRLLRLAGLCGGILTHHHTDEVSRCYLFLANINQDLTGKPDVFRLVLVRYLTRCFDVLEGC